MAEFITRVLKWLAAMVMAYLVLFVLLFFVIIGIGVALQPHAQSITPGSVLVLDLGFRLTDKPSSEDPADLIRSALQGDLIRTVSLRQVLDTVEQAAEDPDISGILITGNLLQDGYGGSFAALREVRHALLQLGEQKPVWSYIDSDSLKDLYLKSVGTAIYSNPFSMVDFRGLRGERLYLGDAFEKIGVEVQVEAFEEYKSAAEAYKRGSMSPEERTQLGSLLSDIWNVLIADIAEARGITPESLDEIANKELILMGEEIRESGFSDELVSRDELIDLLSEVAGYDSDIESFTQVGFLDYMDMASPDFPAMDFGGSGNKVGIVYIEGILLEGEGSDGYVGAERIIRYLRELRKDKAVKAVVLRINSPGGSATASSKVVREIELLNAEKPVVVSMGGMAASAGYMMATAGEQIFSEPLSITGSIGVVIMLPNIEELASKLSINFDGVETHPFAGSFSIGRKKNPEEMRQIREMAADFYDEFLKLVSRTREIPYQRVRELARGRVWSGSAALENGLVDEMGGMMDAVRRAADLAGIGNDFKITERPRRLTFEEQIEEWLTGVSASVPKDEGRSLMGVYHEVENEVRKLSLLNDPFGQYAIMPYTLKLR